MSPVTICSRCGAPVSDDEMFCGGCGLRQHEDVGQGRTEVAPDVGDVATGPRGGALGMMTDEAAGGPSLIPGTSIALGDGENVWREYEVTQLSTRERGRGSLYVTDTRLIFFARARGGGTQRGSVLIQETKIEDITGLAAYVSRRLSSFWLGMAFVFSFLFLVSLVAKRIPFIIFTLLILAGSIFMLIRGVARLGSVGVRIQSGSTQASPIGFGEFGEQYGFFGRILHQLLEPLLALFGASTAFDLLVGFPTPDAERVISELGALIIDIQTKGSLAGTHWGVEPQ